MPNSFSKKEKKLISELVTQFSENIELFQKIQGSVLSQFQNSSKLQSLIHSTKSRIKDPEHLKDKLYRKLAEAKEEGKKFSITNGNLFSKLNDLVGFRLIHLHTRQIEDIDIELQKIFHEQKWNVIEGPSARTWDDEMREYFKGIGFQIHSAKKSSMYTSVHYVVAPNTRSKITCEIQVRTLMEEVWGEVDHSINYPHKSKNQSSRAQLQVLARATSTCSRLVDSIFGTQNGFPKTNPKNKTKSGRTLPKGTKRAPRKRAKRSHNQIRRRK